MDDELLRLIYRHLFVEGTAGYTRRCRFGDALIAFIELFRVMGNFSAKEAMKRSRWPLWTRRLKFPSYSQFNRRARSEPVQRLIAELSDRFRQRIGYSGEKACDGKPLLVGGFSKDPEAKTGKIPGGWGRGYKLHAIVDATGGVDAWDLTALSASEQRVVLPLVQGRDLRAATLRADGAYDCMKLYAAVAEAGGRFVAPRRHRGMGLGHKWQHPDRLRAIGELEGSEAALRAHEKHRNRVEQIFGRLTTVSFGIWGLPASVRRLWRVKRWMNAKLALYHIYLCRNCRVAAA